MLKFTSVAGTEGVTYQKDVNGNTLSATVNVPPDTIIGYLNSLQNHLGSPGSIAGYLTQLYERQIGHALGLGDPGEFYPTDHYPTYGIDNTYINDTWQSTVMSPFSQNYWSGSGETYAYVYTPRPADM